MESLAGKVVVITGASSGLGRATALEFASRGGSVVLAARGREGLDETARLCREASGTAHVVVTDVTREDQVARLVDAARAFGGRIDVWVNNAGVTLFAPIDEGTFDEHRRVIETNLFGPMLCARAVLPVFRQQKRGVLINVGSVLSEIGQPFVPSYTISKFALRGLTEALRAELADEPDIHACSILPYTIDTPHFQSGANALGLEARALPPIQSPQKVARAIADMAERPRRIRRVPRYTALGLALHWLLPKTTERLLLHTLEQWHFAGEEPPKVGNLYRPSASKRHVHGDRKPQVSTPAFAVWVARELVTMQAQAARRRVRVWGERARA